MNTHEELEVGIAEPDTTTVDEVDFTPMLVHLYPKEHGVTSHTTYCGIHGSTAHGLYHRQNGWKTTSYKVRLSLPPACEKCGAPFCPACKAVHNYRQRELNR